MLKGARTRDAVLGYASDSDTRSTLIGADAMRAKLLQTCPRLTGRHSINRLPRQIRLNGTLLKELREAL